MHSFTDLEIVLIVVTLFSLFSATIFGYTSYQSSKLNWDLNAENHQLRRTNAELNRHPAAVAQLEEPDLFKLAGIDPKEAETLRQEWRAQHQPLVDYWQPSLLGDDTLKMLAGR